MSFKILLIVLSILTSLSSQATIIPDVTNPLVMDPPQSPVENTLPSLTFKFSLPSESSYSLGVNKLSSIGANYFQYIGVAFPTFTDLALATKVNNAAPYTCTLTDSSGVPIKVEAEVGRNSPATPQISAEKHVAFCKITEPSTGSLPLTSGKKYILILTFTNSQIRFSNSFIRAVSLFTATGNHQERIIIDSLPVFGNLGLYNNYKDSVNSKVFTIEDAALVVEDNTNIIKPGATFSVSMTFTAKEYIPLADHKIVFRYNSKYFSDTPLPTFTVEPVSPSSTEASQLALSGKISSKAFYAPSGYFAVSLEGSEEEVIPERKFKVRINGIKAKDQVNAETYLEVLVYYKNTFSIIYYSKVINLQMAKITINFSKASHPDGYDVYSNGAWPITFKFSTAVSISSGYVLLRHNNWAEHKSDGGGNILTFIAPTCDFSAMSDIPNGFATRPSCFPLRNTPEPSSGTEKNGSGIFFKLSPIKAGIEYTFTVWAFFDSCGGFPQPAGAFGIGGQAYTQPSFILQIYSDLDTTKTGVERFYTDPTPYLIASSTDRLFSQTCWNASFGIADGAEAFLKYEVFHYIGNIPCADTTIVSPTRLLEAIAPVEPLLMREITDWKAYDLTDDNNSDKLSNVASSNISNEKWVYGTSKFSQNSFVFIKGWVPLFTTYAFAFLPVPILYTNLNNLYAGCDIPRGRLVVQMQTSIPWFKTSSKNFQTGSSSGCILNWRGAYEGAAPVSMEILEAQKALGADTSYGHWIGTGQYPYNTRMINESYPNQFDASSSYSKIISTEHSGVYDNMGWLFAADAYLGGPASFTRYAFSFLTSCTSWATPPAITSIYASIDIQLIWQSYYEGYRPTKVIRYIKLYPEGGVLQETTTAKLKYQGTAPYRNHFAYTAVTDTQSVCLLELAQNLASNYNNGGNTFIVWLSFSSLLESDYSDPAATYPVAPIGSNYTAYGLSSQHTLSIANMYISTYEYKGITSYFNLPAMISRQYTNANAGGAYMFYMGSMILITTSSSTFTDISSNRSVFIPYYCPVYPHAINSSTIRQYSSLPTFVASFMNMSSLSSITEVSSFVLGANRNVVQSAGYKYSKNPEFSGSKLGLKQEVVIRFEKYTNLSTPNVLYMWNKSPTTNSSVNCSGHSFFFAPGFSFKSALSASLASQVEVSEGKRFFVLGKPFVAALMAGSIYPVNILVSTAIKEEYNTITGIVRPDVSFYVNSEGNLQTTDKIAYFCESYGISETGTMNSSILSNYQSGLKKFMLDFYPDNSAVFNPVLIVDRTNDSFKNDLAGSVILNFGPPKTIPSGANVIFASTFFNASTFCGVTVSGQVATPCINNTNEMTCPVKMSASSYNICCYQVKFGELPFSLTSLEIEFPLDPTVLATDTNNIFQNYVSSLIYTYQDVNSVTSSNSENTPNDATITGVKYSTLSYQENAYGKVTFEVSLGRTALRGMKVSIESISLTKIIIDPSIVPRCFASFKEKQNGVLLDADTFIDACSISSIFTSIVVTTKAIPYQCGLQMSKFLYVSLWPVIAYNFAGSTANQHRISITLLDGGANVAKNSGNELVFPPVSPSLSTLNPVSTQKDLCTLKIDPKIPGDPGDYTFTFNLDTNGGNLAENQVINEVLIFWSSTEYGSIIPNISCTVGGVNYGCFFVEENVLVVRFSSGAMSLAKKTEVVVYGVMNPHTSGALNFLCQVATYSNTANRVILLQGTHAYVGGITIKTEAIQGNLKFLSVPAALSSRNPREVSTHVFKIAFDNISGGSTLPFESTSTPLIHIYFPPEYNKLMRDNILPVVSIEEYAWNETAKKISQAAIQPGIGNTIVSGNRITVTLAKSKYSFTMNFKYWLITISHITLPIDAVATRSMRITLTNAEGNIFYSTFTNINNYWSDDLNPIPQNSPLLYNRGIVLVNSSSKWYIDINSSNSILVKPGRYSLTHFTVKPNPVKTPAPAATVVTLSHEKIFLTTQASYAISSSFYEPVYFYFGCHCDTLTGYYIVYFSTADDQLFAPMAPLSVTIGEQEKAQISLTSLSEKIPVASSMWIGYYFDDPNVDVINITWDADTKNIDATAKISGAVIPPGVISGKIPNMSPIFSTFTGTKAADHKFHLGTLGNNCYTIDSPIIITASVTVANANFKDASLKSMLTYTNADTTTIDNFEKNSLRFTLTPKSTPAFIYCALYCSNMAFPTESEMIFRNYDSPNKPGLTANNEFRQYYYNYLAYSLPQVSYDIDFKGLVRGMSYKLKCVLTGTGNKNVSMVNGTIESFNSTFPISISTPAPQATSCMQFYFDNDPSASTKNELVNYCQTFFSSGGWRKNGCVICMDPDSGYNVPGLQLSKYVCPAPSTRILRFLQNSTEILPLDRSVYNLCVIPHSICETNAKLNSNNDILVLSSLNQYLNTTDNISANLLKNVTLNATIVTTDPASIDMTRFDTFITSVNINGAVSWISFYQLGTIKCYWQISSPLRNVTAAIIQDCTDTSRCGSFLATEITTTFGTRSNDLKAFIPGNYELNIACFNSITGVNPYTTVKKYGFTVFPVNPNPNCNNGNNCSNTTNSNWISLSFLVLMILIMVII